MIDFGWLVRCSARRPDNIISPIASVDGLGQPREGDEEESLMLCDCGGELIEIDRYGELLTGCIECNRWRSSRSAFIVELCVEDFEALRKLEVNGRQARPIQ